MLIPLWFLLPGVDHQQSLRVLKLDDWLIFLLYIIQPNFSNRAIVIE